MLYETLLLVGAVGLIAQTVLGMSHGHAGNIAGGGARGNANAHFGGASVRAGGHSASGGTTLQAHGHVHANAHGHGHLHVHLDSRSIARDAASLALTLLSPLTIFSVCVGAGAVGMAAQALHERPEVTAVVAFLGGMIFYAALVRPLSSLLFRFASTPAKTLSGAIAQEAVAASRFDGRGRGVVRLTVDGQLVRLLAEVDAEDRDKAVHIAAGDRLLVTGIDARRNTCRVTTL